MHINPENFHRLERIMSSEGLDYDEAVDFLREIIEGEEDEMIENFIMDLDDN